MATLNKSMVQRWLRDQQAANKQIARERVRRLLTLDTEEAQRIYLTLYQSCLSHTDQQAPSFLLMAMRQALARRSV